MNSPLKTGGPVVGLIPARGGSKGIPRKNLRMLGGKPLITWTIATALACVELDDVLVSTDDEEIAQVASRCGAKVPFLRPPELARDDTPMWPVVRQACQSLQQLGAGAEIIVLLQPTSPLRTVEDIRACLLPVLRREQDATMSVCAADHNPYFVMGRVTAVGWQPLFPGTERLLRRQDAPPVYRKTGSVYVFRERWLNSFFAGECGKMWPVILPAEHSMDIDSEFELEMASAILSRRMAEPAPRLQDLATAAKE